MQKAPLPDDNAVSTDLLNIGRGITLGLVKLFPLDAFCTQHDITINLYVNYDKDYIILGFGQPLRNNNIDEISLLKRCRTRIIRGSLQS